MAGWGAFLAFRKKRVRVINTAELCPTSLQLILTRSRADDYYSYHPWGIDSQQAAPATSLSNANFIDALFSATPVNAFQACWHSIILGYMCAGEVSVELQQLFLN